MRRLLSMVVALALSGSFAAEAASQPAAAVTTAARFPGIEGTLRKSVERTGSTTQEAWWLVRADGSRFLLTVRKKTLAKLAAFEGKAITVWGKEGASAAGGKYLDLKRFQPVGAPGRKAKPPGPK